MANPSRRAGFRADGSLRRSTSAAGMSVFAVVVIVAFLGLMTLDLVRMRNDALAASERNAAAFAMMLAENMRQTVIGVDDALRDFMPPIVGGSDRSPATMGRLRQQLIARVDAIAAIKSFVAFDADGLAFLSWHNWPNRTDGSTRDFFIAHRENAQLGLFVSKLFLNPSTGESVISLTRRLNNPDGSFAGVFAISIDAEYLQRIYDIAAASKQGSLALWREDSMLLVRHPFDAATVGRVYPTSPLMNHYLKIAHAGTYSNVSTVDNIERIISYRKIDGAPLVVAVTESYSEILAAWHELVGRYLALAALIILAVTAFAITVHRQMMNRIANDGRFRAAVDSTSNAFFALSPAIVFDSGRDFTITDANVAAGALLGIDRQSLVGKSLAAVAPGLSRNGVIDVCAEAHEAGFPRDTQVTFVPNGMGERWFRVRTTPFANGIALGMRDVTEEWEARETLKTAKDTAESANRTKSEFLANMSHELRTPLNAIIGFSESLQRGLFGQLADKQLEYVQDIHGAGQHLLAIINDVLDLSRIESGKAALYDEDVNLEFLAIQALRMVRPRAEEKQLAIAMEGVRALPPVRADSMRLQQVFLNLLSNAVKFTPDGGRITFTGAIDVDGGIRLTVADTGIGIAVSDIPKVLMPFESVESAFTRKYKGTGLGLPLAKSLVEMHGGSLTLESVPGRGTTVVILLPPSRIVRSAIAQAV